MSNPELSSLLEEGLTKLQAGASLDEVLADYPKNAMELRPLLETAAGMCNNQSRLFAPVEAQAQSRRQFLSQAASRVEHPGIFHSQHLRLAMTLVIIVALVFGIFSTGLVSASALPGDTLYFVKLAIEQVQLNMAVGPSERLKLQDNFNNIRTQELNQLKDTNRQVTVTFSGIPAKMNGDWMLAGEKLDMTQQDAEQLSTLEGYVVQVTGETRGNSVKVSNVQLQILSFSGKIQEIQPNWWVVDGVKINLDSKTAISGPVNIGQQVNITAQRQDDGQLVATAVDAQNSSASQPEKYIPVVESTNTPGEDQSQPQQTEQRNTHSTPEDHTPNVVLPDQELTPVPPHDSIDSNPETSTTPAPEKEPTRTNNTSRTPDDLERHNPTSTYVPSPNPKH